MCHNQKIDIRYVYIDQGLLGPNVTPKYLYLCARPFTGSGHYWRDIRDQKTLLSTRVLFSNITVLWLCFNSCKRTAVTCKYSSQSGIVRYVALSRRVTWRNYRHISLQQSDRVCYGRGVDFGKSGLSTCRCKLKTFSSDEVKFRR